MAAADKEQTSDEEADVTGKTTEKEQRALQLDFAKIVKELKKEGTVAPSRRFMRMVRDEAGIAPELSSTPDVLDEEGSSAPVGTITRLVENVLAYCRVLMAQGDDEPSEDVAQTLRRLRTSCAEDYGQLLLASAPSGERPDSDSLRSPMKSLHGFQRGNKNAESCTSLARSVLSTTSLATDATSRSPRSSPRERNVSVEGWLEMSIKPMRRESSCTGGSDMSWTGLKPKVSASLSDALNSFQKPEERIKGEVYAIRMHKLPAARHLEEDEYRTEISFRIHLGDEEKAKSCVETLQTEDKLTDVLDNFIHAMFEKASVIVYQISLMKINECPPGSSWHQRTPARAHVHHLQDPLYSAHAAFFESLYALVIRAVQQGLRWSFEESAARGSPTKLAAQQLAARTEEELGRLFRSDAFSKAFAGNGQHSGGKKTVTGAHAEDESAQQAARAEEDIAKLLRSFTDTRTKLLKNIDNLESKITQAAQAVQEQGRLQAARGDDIDRDGKRDMGGVNGGGNGGQEIYPRDGEPNVPNSVDKLIARFRARAPPRNRRSAEHRQAMRTVHNTRSPVMTALLTPACGESLSMNSWRCAQGARNQTWTSAALS